MLQMKRHAPLRHFTHALKIDFDVRKGVGGEGGYWGRSIAGEVNPNEYWKRRWKRRWVVFKRGVQNEVLHTRKLRLYRSDREDTSPLSSMSFLAKDPAAQDARNRTLPVHEPIDFRTLALSGGQSIFTEITVYKYRRLRSRSVHNFGICVWRNAAQWRLPKTKTYFDTGKIGFCHCAAVLQTQVPKLYTDLDLSLLYILILGTYSKFARKNNFLALGVYFPQPCSSAGRRFAASRSRLQNYQRIVSFPQQKFRWNTL